MGGWETCEVHRGKRKEVVMGIFSFIFGNKRSGNGAAPLPEKLCGNGSFPCEVVGESNYDANIAKALGGKTPDGFNDHEIQAVLVLDDNNPYDANAVAVHINGQMSGHLPRKAAQGLRSAVSGTGSKAFTCAASVRGGWDRGNGDVGNFGIWLDLEL